MLSWRMEAQTAADALRKAQAEVRRLEAVAVRLIGFMRRDDPALKRLGSLRDAIRFNGDSESETIRESALRPLEPGPYRLARPTPTRRCRRSSNGF